MKLLFRKIFEGRRALPPWGEQVDFLRKISKSYRLGSIEKYEYEKIKELNQNL